MPFSWVVLGHQSHYPALVLHHQHKCQHSHYRRNCEIQERLYNTVTIWTPLCLFPSLHRRSSSTSWCWLQISASKTACQGTSRDGAIPKGKEHCVCRYISSLTGHCTVGHWQQMLSSPDLPSSRHAAVHLDGAFLHSRPLQGLLQTVLHAL